MMADNRLRFALRLNEMSDELATLAKEVEKNRKQVRVVLTHSIPYVYMCTDEGRSHAVRACLAGVRERNREEQKSS